MNEASHTVLLVDDEQEIIDSLRRTLRNESYRVLGTTSPREALDLVDSESVDVLIADIDMPELDGLELVARVRESHPEIVRILLTGDASLESALRAINDGEVHRYLTKPWHKEGLRDTIRQALERLDELRLAASADRATRARDAMLRELELAHPGIADVALDQGAHVLDGPRLRALVAELDSSLLKELFEPGTELGTSEEEAPTQKAK